MNPVIQPDGDADYTGSATTVSAVPGTPTPTTIAVTYTVDNAQTVTTNVNGSYNAATVETVQVPTVTTVAEATTTFDNTPTITTNPDGSTVTVYDQPVAVGNNGAAPFYSTPV